MADVTKCPPTRHVTLNEAHLLLDTLVQASVFDKDLSSPPGSPGGGDTYIVAPGATGLWAGHDGDLARYREGVWAFLTPTTGWTVWVQDEEAVYVFSGLIWEVLVGLGSGGGGVVVPSRSPTKAPW